MTIFLIAFAVLLIIGVPISISIGASAVLGCLSLGYPLVVIGDGSGITHSLSHASASGVHVARQIAGE